MRKIFFIIGFILYLIFHFNFRTKGCNYFYVISGDTLINSGEPINILLSAASWNDCQHTGTCFLSDFQWFKNGIQLPGETNYIFAANDTGLFRVDFISNCYGHRSNSFHIGYKEEFSFTDQSELKKISPFIYPAGSSTFRINMCGKKMKQLFLSENSGKLVLSLLNGVTEINMENFSSGIYYYTIYDEDKNAWRGKIVKD